MSNIAHRERRDWHRRIEQMVTCVGNDILSQNNPSGIYDTRDIKGHEESTIDYYARERMQAAIDTYLPMFEGIIRFELRPYHRKSLEKSEQCPYVLSIDEIDGTTNAKRAGASCFSYPPQSLISCALSTSDELGSIVIGAVYALDNKDTISAIEVEGGVFMAFCNGQLINEQMGEKRLGDSKDRIIVAGYSNSHRRSKGEVEEALYNKSLKVYDGCRASGVDIIAIMRNQFDAYVDMRHHWSTLDENLNEKEAMLQAYDIAGVLPIAKGCGLVVTDTSGKPIDSYTTLSTLPLVVARPSIHPLIIETIQPFVEQWKKGSLQVSPTEPIHA